MSDSVDRLQKKYKCSHIGDEPKRFYCICCEDNAENCNCIPCMGVFCEQCNKVIDVECDEVREAYLTKIAFEEDK